MGETESEVFATAAPTVIPQRNARGEKNHLKNFQKWMFLALP